MRIRSLLVCAICMSLVSFAQAAPFVNLDFEQATVPPGTGQTIDASLAFPGWTARIGDTVQNQISYNDTGIGGPAVVLYDQSLGIGGLPVLQGRYSIVLITDFPDGAAGSLSQTGDIPSDARSLRFLGPNRPPVVVKIDGTSLPLVQILNPLSSLPAWAADVTAFAGGTVDLRLSSVHPPNGGIAGADALTFSSVPVPEPSAATVTTLIGGLAALMGRSRMRFRRSGAGE